MDYSSITPIAQRITVHETNNGKLPGCYLGKTFELEQDFYSDGLPYGPFKYIAYRSTLKNGKVIFFTQYPGRLAGPQWHVKKETAFTGSWLSNVTVI